MRNNDEAAKAIMLIITELAFLVVGTVLVGIGTNFYFAIGLALLLIYNKDKP